MSASPLISTSSVTRWSRNIKYVALAMTLALALSAKAKDHTVDLVVNCDGEMVGWHFSRINGAINFNVEGFDITKSFFTKMDSRDESNPMHKGDQVADTIHIDGPGVYVLDFSDWKETSRIEAVVTIDKTEQFRVSTAGVPTHDNPWLKNWHYTLGPNAKVSPGGDREILFNVD
jgi:hypothetical protein